MVNKRIISIIVAIAAIGAAAVTSVVIKRRRIIGTVIALALVLGLTQCSSSGDAAGMFPKEEDLSFVPVLVPEDYQPVSLLVYRDLFVVLGYPNQEGGNTLYVYDSEWNLLSSGVSVGRGPLETLYGYKNVTLRDGSVVFHDFHTKERLTVVLPDFKDSFTLAISKEPVDLPSWCTCFTENAKGQEIRVVSRSFLKDLDMPQRTVQLVDGDSVSEWEGSPFENRELSFVMSMQPQITFTPEGDRMALASFPGATIEIFDMKNGIRRIACEQFIEPRITPKNGSYEWQEDYVFGMESISSDGNYIYASFDGETTAADVRMDEKPLLFKNIALFDWDGHPKILYKTDYRVEKVCPANDVLYAVLNDGKIGRFIGKADISSNGK